MTKTIGRNIGDSMGGCIQVDVDSQGNSKGSYLRIRVMIDAKKPLRRGIKLRIKGDQDPQWFPIQYERVPNFCYLCGLLGHVMEDCEKYEEEGDITDTPFGNWLRARNVLGDSGMMMRRFGMERNSLGQSYQAQSERSKASNPGKGPSQRQQALTIYVLKRKRRRK